MAVPKDKTQYITAYYPQTSKNISHHMVLYGCSQLPDGLDERNLKANGEAWYCGPSGIGICKRTNKYYEDVVYAWALDADGFELPDGSGFRIGLNSNINYLVLQMHYKEEFKSDFRDNSGLTLRITEEE